MNIKETEINEMLTQLRRSEKLLLSLKRRKKEETAITPIEKNSELRTAQEQDNEQGMFQKPHLFYHFQMGEIGIQIYRKDINDLYHLVMFNRLPKGGLKKSEKETRENLLKKGKYGDFPNLQQAKQEFINQVYWITDTIKDVPF